MGTEKKKRLRAVLDTNILVSALLFKGQLCPIAQLWKEGRFTPLISKETFDEFKTVLDYPKFSLEPHEIELIVTVEVLPYFEVVDIREPVLNVCDDPHDDKFLSCAVSGSADYIVTGDKALYGLRRYKSVAIIKASDFIKLFA